MALLTAFLVLLGAYLTIYVLYQTFLFAANSLIAEQANRESVRVRRFAVLLPSHNEELYLPRLLGTFASQDYPQADYRVHVIADNCSDRTAAESRRFDVEVLERTEPAQRGKGYAIGWALQRIGLD